MNKFPSTLLLALALSLSACATSPTPPASVPAPVAAPIPAAAPVPPEPAEKRVEKTYLNRTVEDVVNNPPSLSRTNGGGETFDLPGGAGQVIVESDEIIGYLQFTADANPEQNNYRFRTYSKIFRQEINGDGRVFDKLYRIMDPLRKERFGSSIAIDKGSVGWVDAGFYKIRWSLGSYVYYDETRVKAAGGSEEAFEDRMRAHARAHLGEPVPTR